MAQYSVEVINPTKIKIAKQQPDVLGIRQAAKASKESKVELLCLEDIWQNILLNSGWSNVAASHVKFYWADSTLQNYNILIHNFQKYCTELSVKFLPEDN